ncbi:MAG: ABC transporter substrate-binding protein [Clostridia bacterium]|nr:ABC transporter substrate-binding protein [Clostridia bacterium]
MFKFNKFIAVSIAAISIIFTACSKTDTQTQQSTESTTGGSGNVVINNPILPDVNDDMAPTEDEKITINVGLVKNSAAAIGAVHLFTNTENNSAYEKYTPVVFNTADELLEAFKSGEVSVASMPVDKAALCYDETACSVAAITTGCNYYIAENGKTVRSFTDLNGKTVAVSAEDTLAQTILDIIAKYNNIELSYTVIDTTANLINGLKDGTITLALTQEPYLSQVTGDTVRSALDLYDFWNEAVDTELVTSCLVVNKNFISENPVAFQFFLKDYSASSPMAKRNTEETAESAGKFALVDDVTSSKSAIPGCGITFKTGSDMKSMLTSFYNVISENAGSISGVKAPDDDFYFVQQTEQ